MSKIDDGGPAFPKTKTAGIDTQLQDGMSLRDWFAGQALSASYAELRALRVFGHEGEHLTAVASDAYAIADAMIAARKTGASE